MWSFLVDALLPPDIGSAVMRALQIGLVVFGSLLMLGTMGALAGISGA